VAASVHLLAACWNDLDARKIYAEVHASGRGVNYQARDRIVERARVASARRFGSPSPFHKNASVAGDAILIRTALLVLSSVCAHDSKIVNRKS